MGEALSFSAGCKWQQCMLECNAMIPNCTHAAAGAALSTTGFVCMRCMIPRCWQPAGMLSAPPGPPLSDKQHRPSRMCLFWLRENVFTFLNLMAAGRNMHHRPKWL